MVKLALALVVFSSAAQPPAQNPAFKINPKWLASYYYSNAYFVVAYTLKLTAPNGVLEGRIRSTGSWSDSRRLFNIRIVANDVFEGDWESDPVFDMKGKLAKGNGTFKAFFNPSNGNSFYIQFKAGPTNQIETEFAEWSHFWIRRP